MAQYSLVAVSTADRGCETTSEPKQERRDACEHAGNAAAGRGESLDFPMLSELY